MNEPLVSLDSPLDLTGVRGGDDSSGIETVRQVGKHPVKQHGARTGCQREVCCQSTDHSEDCSVVFPRHGETADTLEVEQDDVVTVSPNGDQRWVRVD